MRVIRTLVLLAGFAGQWLSASAQDNVCRPQDRTFSNEQMPAGTHQPLDAMNKVRAAFNSKFYVTVVNLTPHRFKLDHTASYQMPTFDWGDVPQGKARQNMVRYRNTISTGDDAGEAYYHIEGTDKNFVLRVTSRMGESDPRRVILDLSGMGLGQREYAFPGAESGVSLVITGSAKTGFIANLRHGNGAWMRGMYDVIKDRPLRHLIMPGSHDAGMSRITNQIISIGIDRNTQNQAINIEEQLLAGARWFDLRVASIHDGDDARPKSFHVMHVNDEMADVVIGNTGESLDDVIAEVNRFTAANRGEIIIFSLRYLVGRRKNPGGGPIIWSDEIEEIFYEKMRAIHNRCLNLDTSKPFQHHPARYFMDQNGGGGCVLIFLHGKDRNGVAERLHDGVYEAGRIDVRDHWSNMMHADAVAPNQVEAWRQVERGSDADARSPIHIAQWLSTPDAVASTLYSLENFAVQHMNPALYWAGVNSIDPEHFPNVILVDYVGVQRDDYHRWDELSAELYTLVIGLNLYTVSENCRINSRRSPLLKRGGDNSLPLLERRGSAWNGIIYANGTVIDNPPADCHPGHMTVLPKGTLLNNGTVLTTNTVNQWR